MHRTHRTLALLALLAGCATKEPAPDTHKDPGAPPSCDATAVFARSGCSSAGCHGAQYAAVDLLSGDVAARLVGQPSRTAACAGRLIIDPKEPERSLLLTLTDARRHRADGCGVLMPLGSQGLGAEDVACLEAWVKDAARRHPAPPSLADQFDPAAPEVYGAKVKTLLSGGALTDDELAALRARPEALRDLVSRWIEAPAFEDKMTAFLRTALQQDSIGAARETLGFPTSHFVASPLLRENLRSSFARTAWRYPFNEPRRDGGAAVG